MNFKKIRKLKKEISEYRTKRQNIIQEQQKKEFKQVLNFQKN